MIDKLKMAQESRLELLFYEQLEQAGLAEGIEWQKPISGHKVDFCWEHLKIIVEIQGGTEGFGKGRGSHVREPQYSIDRQFSNFHQMDSWWVLEFTKALINSGEALETIKIALEARRG